MLIGRASVRGTEAVIHAFNPATNAAIGPAFDGGGAASATWPPKAYDSCSRTAPEARARFIEAVADNLMALGNTLVERVMVETGLPRPRVEGEQARTAVQLRIFASLI